VENWESILLKEVENWKLLLYEKCNIS